MFSFILFAPLAGAVLGGLFGRAMGDRAAMVLTTGLLFLCCLLSWVAFLTLDHEAVRQITVMRWIDSGSMSVDWAIRVDTLTAVMLVVVTSVSALVHLYSIGYMEDDPAKARFFAYLSFFTFAMLMLVTADNLAQMFFGWEGVGVASYLLIGFWFHKESANNAAMKAFIVNRVGDFGYALGIFGLFYMVDSIQFDDIFAAAPALATQSFSFIGMQVNAAEALALLLFIGAMGKSAQLFLHTWLPDAMEGPTPVSALIHAATMVTAGVFLVCRMSPLFEQAPGTLWFVTIIGASTAFFAATVALVQTDIKRVIAYSTCSQLGYMFAAAGIGAYEAAMFHLFTHAFFKALLFLGAGSVIHAMHHEQDMRKMGGLKEKIPLTWLMMLVGTLSITGVGVPLLYVFDIPIGLAGFVSKDVIIESAFASPSLASGYAFLLLLAAAGMTSFYSWRLMFLTFHGRTRADHHTFDHAHESPRVMMIPLYVLAVGGLLAGMEFYPDFVGHHENAFWGPSIFTVEGNDVLHESHAVHWLVKLSPFLAMLAGLYLAYIMYVRSPALPAQLAARHRSLYLFLLNKWYFDELYEIVFVRSAKRLGRLFWKQGDEGAIDGAINGLALGVTPWVTRLAGRAQTGYLYHYAFAMLLGVSALITWYAVRGA